MRLDTHTHERPYKQTRYTKTVDTRIDGLTHFHLHRSIQLVCPSSASVYSSRRHAGVALRIARFAFVRESENYFNELIYYYSRFPPAVLLLPYSLGETRIVMERGSDVSSNCVRATIKFCSAYGQVRCRPRSARHRISANYTQ